MKLKVSISEDREGSDPYRSPLAQVNVAVETEVAWRVFMDALHTLTVPALQREVGWPIEA